MDKLKHYKFINSETGNVIYFLSLPESSSANDNELERMRIKIAADNDIYIGSVYFVLDDENSAD
ncbi:hypothetical protein B0I27_101222 [Arcticibacter pallidicorallinus]|uniref:Uncharacterized protein n=1 Tax=Arcticibacter pallidicorallinus TaxID=1259464 RepID=A0A2T0UBG4_9SPHI|nr:hypothetical protein [Arcticibacter pallidicorallinus]PRY55253.1 hypothetical protein B0I27_101222 [Arcticibacter pallidicorallinus]